MKKMELLNIWRNSTLAMSLNKNYLKMLIAMVFWGASFVFIKITYKYIGPVSMIFSRLVIATTILFILNKILFKSTIDKKDIKTFLLLGCLEPFLYFIGEGYGLKYVSSTQASVIIATIPIFAMISSMIFYKERVGRMNIVGVLISFIGVLIMIGLSDLLDKGRLLGLILMFLAVFAAVGNSLVLVKLGKKYSSFTIITYQNLIGALLFLPLFIILEFKNIDLSLFNSELIIAILFLSIFPSVLSFLLYISVLKKIGVTKTAVFSNLIPIFTGILSFILLGDRFVSREIIGIIIVIIGLFLSQRNNKKIVLTEY